MKVFGYINSPIVLPQRIKLPIDTLLRARYPNYVQVMENDSERKITVCLPEGKREIRLRPESTESEKSSHTLLFMRLIDEYVAKSSENKLIFHKLHDLGSSIGEAAGIYLYLLEKAVKVEFISSPTANTERFLHQLERMPESTRFAMLDLFKAGYEMEGHNIDADEYPISNDPQFTQLGQDEKKVC